MGTSLPPVGVRFQAEGVPQVFAAFKSVSDQSGRFTAITRQSFTAVNATGFALSQFAAGGGASFKSLSTAATGFLSFFGPGGAIAAGVISVGSILTDFWQRQQKNIEDARAKASAELAKFDTDVEGLRRSRDPASIVAKLADDSQELAEKRVALAAIEHRAEFARTETEKARIPVLRERIALLEKEIAIGTRAAFEPRGPVGTGTLGKVTTTVQSENARRDAISKTITALTQLRALDKLTGQDLVTLATLYATLNRELLTGNVALQRRAEIEGQLSTIRKTGLQAPAVRDLIADTPQAKSTLAQPFISPSTARSFTSTTGETFGAAFAESIQSGMQSGVQQLVSGGGFTGIFNTLGAGIVAQMATLNPWLGVAGGILQGAIGGLLGGGRDRGPRGAELPIDIRRVITDPNFRNPVRATPGQVIQVIGINTPHGQRLIGTSSASFRARGGRS